MPSDVVIGFHPDDDQGIRWVSTFCKLFQIRLRQMGLRPPPECWSFDDIAGFQRVSDTQCAAIRDCRVLIAILSFLYCAPDEHYSSHWAGLQQALGIDDFSTRFFPVEKLPPNPSPTFRTNDLKGYKFWRDSDRRRIPIELVSDTKEYAEELNALAYDVAAVLKKVRAASSSQGVFLASPPPSLENEWEALRTWLLSQRLKLYTAAEFSRSVSRDQYGQMVDDVLVRCELSIHLLGPEDGRGTPELEGQSPVAIEYYRSRARLATGRIAAVAWCPPKLVRREDASRYGVLADLFARPSTSFDDLTNETAAMLHVQVLRRLRQPIEPALRELKCLYVVSHPSDQPRIAPMLAELKDGGYQVETTATSFESPAWRDEYAGKLKKSHATVMCGGNAPLNFLEYLQQVALDQVQANLNFPLDRMALYIGPDHSPEKDRFLASAPFKNKLVDYTGFCKAGVDPFLTSAFGGVV